jgi:hypothetical protein
MKTKILLFILFILSFSSVYSQCDKYLEESVIKFKNNKKAINYGDYLTDPKKLDNYLFINYEIKKDSLGIDFVFSTKDTMIMSSSMKNSMLVMITFEDNTVSNYYTYYKTDIFYETIKNKKMMKTMYFGININPNQYHIFLDKKIKSLYFVNEEGEEINVKSNRKQAKKLRKILSCLYSEL